MISGILLLIGILILIAVRLNFQSYRPYVDRTSKGDVVIWYNNSNGKRVFKYLYKKDKNGWDIRLLCLF